MEIGQTYTVYVRVLSNEEWLGAWAPVQARLEWLHLDAHTALFTLLDNDLTEEDEYAFWQSGTLLLARQEEREWWVEVGVEEPTYPRYTSS